MNALRCHKAYGHGLSQINLFTFLHQIYTQLFVFLKLFISLNGMNNMMVKKQTIRDGHFDIIFLNW